MAQSQVGEGVIFYGVGDTAPWQEPYTSIFDFVRQDMKAADICFAQVERTFSERGQYQMQGWGTHTRVPPAMAAAYQDCFNVVSLASDHSGDWGPEALEDTIGVFKELGIATCGAGRNNTESRKASILERKGIRIAFVGYCSVGLPNYWATDEGAPWGQRSGVAPMRAHTYYEPHEYQPGSPPRVVTISWKDDLEALQEDMHRAKQQSDIVVMSIHWGIHDLPKFIADYEVEVTHAAIDAGADLILGHHQHLLKAIEVYKGKVCFHGLGTFALSLSPQAHSLCCPDGVFDRREVYRINVDPDFDYYKQGFERYSGVAKAVLSKDGVERVSFLPALINDNNQPRILKPNDDKFREVVDYQIWASSDFDTRFTIEGDELVVDTTASKGIYSYPLRALNTIIKGG